MCVVVLLLLVVGGELRKLVCSGGGLLVVKSARAFLQALHSYQPRSPRQTVPLLAAAPQPSWPATHTRTPPHPTKQPPQCLPPPHTPPPPRTHDSSFAQSHCRRRS